MGSWAKMIALAMLCLAAAAPWTGVNGQFGEGPASSPGLSPEAAPGPATAEGPSSGALPDADRMVVDNMEAELDEMVLNEAMGPSSALAPGVESPAAAPSSTPRSIGPSDSPVVESPPTVASTTADDGLTTADRILQNVRDGDTEGAADEIVAAVSRGEVDMVTAAAVLARDEGLSSEMAEALSATLRRGVRPSEIREAFAIVGSG